MLRSVLISVAVLLSHLLLVGCNTNVGQMVEDAGRSSPMDSCPNDPEKTSPGLCGCGIPDDNTDGDSVPDCRDACPTDPNKNRPGMCGCGNRETDSDRDGTPDCVDSCPNDPEKTAPGECGCGEPEVCNALTLLVRPVDEIVVLSDLSVWDVGRFTGVTTAIRWLADDPIEEYTPPASSDADFGLLNLRTNGAVGADFIGVGSRVTIVRFQEQEFGHRLIGFDDGSTWGIFFADENESRTWRVGDDVVIYDVFFFDEAISLRTGRVIALDSTSEDSLGRPPEPEPPPTFVSGDIFTFLTPDETDYFLSRVRTLNDAILTALLNELAAAALEDSLRGLSGGGAASARACQLSQEAVRARREGTWVALQEVGDFLDIIFNLTPSEVQEIEDFNCREYPSLTCSSIVLPC